MWDGTEEPTVVRRESAGLFEILEGHSWLITISLCDVRAAGRPVMCVMLRRARR
jgi:hypothetical protein